MTPQKTEPLSPKQRFILYVILIGCAFVSFLGISVTSILMGARP